jgi:acyl carrier protein
MGPDTVEFIVAAEVGFALEIADADAARIATPRDLIPYLRARLPAADDAPCLTQQAFPPTLGAATRHLATWGPAAVKRGAGWTDRQVEACVVALIEAELGVDVRRHKLDAEFVRDLGLD